MRPGVTVVIPTIPPRVEKLQRAVNSVLTQTQPVDAISIAVDTHHKGAGDNRQNALNGVSTHWVAFLDDDDFYYPNYVETVLGLATSHDADVVYTWFDGNNPFPMHRGKEWNPQDPHHITSTLLVRTELAKEVGFIHEHPEGWILPQEDWQFITGLNNIGAKFVGTGEALWYYTIDNANTSGLPTRW